MFRVGYRQTPSAPHSYPPHRPRSCLVPFFFFPDHDSTSTTNRHQTTTTDAQPRLPRPYKTNTITTPFLTPWGSRKRPRCRAAAVVLSAIVVLTFLLIFRAPAASLPSSPPSTTTTTPSAVLRGNGATSAVAAVGPAPSLSAESAGGGVESERPPPDLGVEDNWREGGRAQESELDGGGAGAGARESVAGRSVTQEGGGGKLKDGRDRCFVDSEGSQRCYPTVFFFGTSKCGKLLLLVVATWSLLLLLPLGCSRGRRKWWCCFRCCLGWCR